MMQQHRLKQSQNRIQYQRYVYDREWELRDYLNEFIKNMHNQQQAQLHNKTFQSYHSRFYYLMNLTNIESLIINLLTQYLNLSISSLPYYIHYQTQYHYPKYFILTKQLRKVGAMSKSLAKLIKFTSYYERFLAEYYTMKFLQLFNHEKQYSLTKNHQYNLQFVNFIKPIYPRVNVHKDNLPLYIPFYNSIDSYEKDAPIGNPNWELARKVLMQVYEQEMMGVLDDDTRYYDYIKGEINDGDSKGENNDINNGISKRDIWFKLLTCDPSYLKRHSHKKTGIYKIWSLMHFFYVQHTLKPYRTMSPYKNINIINNNDEQFELQEEVSMNTIIYVLKDTLKQYSYKTMKLLYSVMLYQLTENDWDLGNVIQLLKCMLEEELLYMRANNQMVDTRDKSNNRELNFAALLNTVSCQLVKNMTETYNSKQMKDYHRITILTYLLKQTIDAIHLTVSHRLPYHEYYLRIAYPSHTADAIERRNNEQKIFDILLEYLEKDNYDTINKYSFPEYAYFEKEFYYYFSKAYLTKHPSKIVEVTQHLPADVAVWGLINSPTLYIHREFVQIRSILFRNQSTYLECINKRVPEVTNVVYVNFIQSWDMYHYMLNCSQYLLDEYSRKHQYNDIEKFINKLNKFKININYISGLDFPYLFRYHIYFALDKGENILKMLIQMVDGLDDILLTVNLDTQYKIINEYLEFLSEKKFKKTLYAKLTEEQRDEFWKRWVTVYLADGNLVKELVGGAEIYEGKDKMIKREEIVIEEKPMKQQKQSKKLSNEIIIMDLYD